MPDDFHPAPSENQCSGQETVPSVAPDLSKLCRRPEDALQAAGVLRDDALIVEYTRLAKVYVDEDPEALDRPGCLIIMAELVDSLPVEGSLPPGRRRHATGLRGINTSAA